MGRIHWTRWAGAGALALGLTLGRLGPTPAQDGGPPPGPRAVSAQDALLRPVDLAFAEPTRLDDLAARLGRELGLRVVLDRAALGRLDLTADATVQLDLQGARLKTGLKLLLDQVGMTYTVVPEDDLLILTDREGSEDPLDKLGAELKVVHQELHDLRDAVEAIADVLGVGLDGEGPVLRNPTIIEEKPGPPAEPPGDAPPARTRPGI